jgi:hypothetical protein
MTPAQQAAINAKALQGALDETNRALEASRAQVAPLQALARAAAQSVLCWRDARSRREIENGLARLRDAITAAGLDIEEVARG